MLNKFLASTAFIALLSGSAYAQSVDTENTQAQEQQLQDRLTVGEGQEIHVRSGDTLTLDSADIEFTLRLQSAANATGGEMATRSATDTEARQDDMATGQTADSAVQQSDELAANDATDAPMDADEDAATAEAPAADTAEDVAELPAENAPMGEATVDADRMAGDMSISNGDVVIVATEGDSFQLNFEIRDADAVAMTTQDEAATDDSVITSAIDRDNLQARTLDQIRADDLIGSTVYGANEEKIGSVGDVILTQDGAVEAVLVDVGGFLGIGAREVAIGLDNINFMVDDRENWYVYTPFTEEQLKDHPEYDSDSYASDRDRQLLIVR